MVVDPSPVDVTRQEIGGTRPDLSARDEAFTTISGLCGKESGLQIPQVELMIST
jgi:hypothetical protein